MIETHISNIFVGKDRAYIYIWYSIGYKVIYVGMTNSRLGTLGRAFQHLCSDGTLRMNFERELGFGIDDTDDFRLFSFLLPQEKIFTSVERSYREAVEYLIQKQLIERQSITNIYYKIISWVRDSPRSSNSYVRSIATEIVETFIERLEKIAENNQT